VHHGNGTQHIFEEDPSVLYMSTHQFPLYPGTGAADETGHGSGDGFTVNLPLEVGAVDEDYQVVFAEVVVPVLRQFKPSLILVSAGVDAHERDPLAGMRLTTAAFGAMTADVRRVADECCEGRIVAMTEGGYDLKALAESLLAVAAALAGGPVSPKPASGSAGEGAWTASRPGVDARRGRAAVDSAKAHLRSFWTI
jgi:acetoin utilization deacetylase AcuC-like enzyme